MVIKRLFILMFFCMAVSILPVRSFAHQAPYSVAYLDVSPDRVGVEIHIPLTELALAYNSSITQDPANLLQRMAPQLKEYILAHTHAYVKRKLPWTVKITNMVMGREEQIASGPPFWELRVYLLLLPQQGENTRHFMFDYDAVVHQVINHIIFVTIRSDWETGRTDSLTADSNPMTIRISGDNKIHPLEINLDKGSQWKGFKNMVALGMEHIKEGTDHLLFLLVLLLPSTLVVKGKRWAGFGGTKYSIIRLLKIVTAFTVGHSITLLLGATGLFIPPQQPIEVLIAVSILISAIHALYPVFPNREFYISGGFGLIHGLSFAVVLSNMHLAAGTLVLSIFGFNLGIELMQLFIIALIVPWLIILSKTPVYKPFRITGAILAVIASVAWISERCSGTENCITDFIANEYTHAIWLIIAIAILSIIAYWWNDCRLKSATVDNIL